MLNASLSFDEHCLFSNRLIVYDNGKEPKRRRKGRKEKEKDEREKGKLDKNCVRCRS